MDDGDDIPAATEPSTDCGGGVMVVTDLEQLYKASEDIKGVASKFESKSKSKSTSCPSRTDRHDRNGDILNSNDNANTGTRELRIMEFGHFDEKSLSLFSAMVYRGRPWKRICIRGCSGVSPMIREAVSHPGAVRELCLVLGGTSDLEEYLVPVIWHLRRATLSGIKISIGFGCNPWQVSSFLHWGLEVEGITMDLLDFGSEEECEGDTQVGKESEEQATDSLSLDLCGFGPCSMPMFMLFARNSTFRSISIKCGMTFRVDDSDSRQTRDQLIELCCNRHNRAIESFSIEGHCKGDGNALLSESDTLHLTRRLLSTPTMRSICFTTGSANQSGDSNSQTIDYVLGLLQDSDHHIGNTSLCEFQVPTDAEGKSAVTAIDFYLQLNRKGYRNRLGVLSHGEWLEALAGSFEQQDATMGLGFAYYILRSNPGHWSPPLPKPYR